MAKKTDYDRNITSASVTLFVQRNLFALIVHEIITHDKIL